MMAPDDIRDVIEKIINHPGATRETRLHAIELWDKLSVKYGWDMDKGG